MNELSDDFKKQMADIREEQEANTIKDATSSKKEKKMLETPKTDVRTFIANGFETFWKQHLYRVMFT